MTTTTNPPSALYTISLNGRVEHLSLPGNGGNWDVAFVDLSTNQNHDFEYIDYYISDTLFRTYRQSQSSPPLTIDETPDSYRCIIRNYAVKNSSTMGFSISFDRKAKYTIYAVATDALGRTSKSNTITLSGDFY